MTLLSQTTQTTLRAKAPQALASATFLFAGYGIGHIAATLAKLVVG